MTFTTVPILSASCDALFLKNTRVPILNTYSPSGMHPNRTRRLFQSTLNDDPLLKRFGPRVFPEPHAGSVRVSSHADGTITVRSPYLHASCVRFKETSCLCSTMLSLLFDVFSRLRASPFQPLS